MHYVARHLAYPVCVRGWMETPRTGVHAARVGGAVCVCVATARPVGCPLGGKFTHLLLRRDVKLFLKKVALKWLSLRTDRWLAAATRCRLKDSTPN